MTFKIMEKVNEYPRVLILEIFIKKKKLANFFFTAVYILHKISIKVFLK